MKQEHTESPSSTALASRIARYSYGSPSPGGKRQPVTPVKREPGPSVSPHFTRTRTRGTDLSPKNGVVRSPHFSNPTDVPFVQAPVTGGGVGATLDRTPDSDDDLESIDSHASSQDGSLPSRDFEEVEDSEDESDGLGDLVSDDRDEEAAATPNRSQIRIQVRRAGRAERHLVQEGESRTVTGARKRRKIKREDSDDGEVGTTGTPKKKKVPRGYAAPEIYQHLRPLPDLLAPGLDVVFCGINPGVRSSTTGHHFGHPTNKFWRSLHQSGLTPRLIKPEEDHLLPAEFRYGMTVLVDRPTAEQSELSTHEMRLNVLPFTEKLLGIKPKVVCFVGKKIWDVYESVVSKSAKAVNTGQGNVKEEQDETTVPSSEGNGDIGPSVKEEQGTAAQEDIKPSIADDTPTVDPSTTPRRQARTPAKLKEKFDWTKSRPFRLPHHVDGQIGYMYFWVVPNTSGLERTPLAEQIVLFGHLKAFTEELQAGRVEGIYRDIDIGGVKKTVDGLKVAAEARQIKRD